MELRAEIYTIADKAELVEQAKKLIIDNIMDGDGGTWLKAKKGKNYQKEWFFDTEEISFPLQPSNSTWSETLNECGEILGYDGIVVVYFRNLNSGEIDECFYSTPGGMYSNDWSGDASGAALKKGFTEGIDFPDIALQKEFEKVVLSICKW